MNLSSTVKYFDVVMVQKIFKNKLGYTIFYWFERSSEIMPDLKFSGAHVEEEEGILSAGMMTCTFS